MNSQTIYSSITKSLTAENTFVLEHEQLNCKHVTNTNWGWYIYIYKHTTTHGQTDRQTDKKTDSQTYLHQDHIKEPFWELELMTLRHCDISLLNHSLMWWLLWWVGYCSLSFFSLLVAPCLKWAHMANKFIFHRRATTSGNIHVSHPNFFHWPHCMKVSPSRWWCRTLELVQAEWRPSPLVLTKEQAQQLALSHKACCGASLSQLVRVLCWGRPTASCGGVWLSHSYRLLSLLVEVLGWAIATGSVEVLSWAKDT